MDVNYYISFVGYVSIFYVSFRCFSFLWTMFRCYCLTSIGFVKDLRKYGEWVIVTGATDGIGKEYARQFAKQGLKIVLISRTRAKLEEVSKEIEDEFHMETKIICFDFTQTVGYDNIKKVITELDVGILVNNVGMGVEKFGVFNTTDINKVCDCMHVNMFSDVHMTHMVLKGMVDRKRGAIIHISSGSIYIDIPVLNVYPPTKVFMEKFYKSLQLEYPGVIDHQLVTPGYVSTNMSKKKCAVGIPSAEDYVMSAIRTIGIMDVTCGYFIHDLNCALLRLLPGSVKLLIAESVKKDLLKQL